MSRTEELIFENASLREKCAELNEQLNIVIKSREQLQSTAESTMELAKEFHEKLTKAEAKLIMFEKMLLECKEVLATLCPTMSIGITELLKDWED